MANWQEYTEHSDENIKGFFGYYRFLSNFYPAKVYFDGLMYPSSETAYQAAKLLRDYREPFTQMSESDSKKAWRNNPPIAIIPNWDMHKYRVMDIIVYDKFTRNEDLKQKLIDTGDRYLEETNHWKDTCWGVHYKTNEGNNWLGQILMEVRRLISLDISKNDLNVDK